jgi:hypothetical protein
VVPVRKWRAGHLFGKVDHENPDDQAGFGRAEEDDYTAKLRYVKYGGHEGVCGRAHCSRGVLILQGGQLDQNEPLFRNAVPGRLPLCQDSSDLLSNYTSGVLCWQQRGREGGTTAGWEKGFCDKTQETCLCLAAPKHWNWLLTHLGACSRVCLSRFNTSVNSVVNRPHLGNGFSKLLGISSNVLVHTGGWPPQMTGHAQQWGEPLTSEGFPTLERRTPDHVGIPTQEEGDSSPRPLSRPLSLSTPTLLRLPLGLPFSEFVSPGASPQPGTLHFTSHPLTTPSLLPASGGAMSPAQPAPWSLHGGDIDLHPSRSPRGAGWGPGGDNSESYPGRSTGRIAWGTDLANLAAQSRRSTRGGEVEAGGPSGSQMPLVGSWTQTSVSQYPEEPPHDARRVREEYRPMEAGQGESP